MTVSVDGGNVYVFVGSIDASDVITGTNDDNDIVQISTVSVKHNFQKQITSLDIPVSFINQVRNGGSSTPLTYLIDLLRIKRLITVDGWLDDEASQSALTKKNNIINLCQRGGNVQVVWGQNSTSTRQLYSGNFDKFEVAEVPDMHSSDLGQTGFITTSLKRGFKIVFSLHIGTDYNSR